jgi:hypothetical protein
MDKGRRKEEGMKECIVKVIISYRSLDLDKGLQRAYELSFLIFVKFDDSELITE